MAEPTEKVIEALVRSGLLLQQDKRLPNVVTLVTGESLRTSWWSHPKGRLVFAVLSDLSEHSDVLFTKLLFGKVTLVHRSLWPAFLAVALAREPWQTRGLSASGRGLLRKLRASKTPVRSAGPAVQELEVRLLAHAREIHTESGRHEILVATWSAWSREAGVEPMRSTALARRRLEAAAQAMGAPPAAFPWPAGMRAAG
ncbi:MAG: hypothetical protein M3R62_09840 [Acidobacteriota bacterium]|nr:hypothetical protein [Acidobacteriota bacterium]